MNSNSYLGLSFRRGVIAAEEEAARRFGSGPGCGALHQRHLGPARRTRAAARRLPRARGGDALQLRLCHRHVAAAAADHRPDGGDQRRAQPQLHHQRHRAGAAGAQGASIATSTSRSSSASSSTCAGSCRRAIVVTDGVFSMRGDHAPLDEIIAHRPPATTRASRERDRRGRRLARRRRLRRDGSRHRGGHAQRPGRPAGRHARQGLRRQRRLRRRQRAADRATCARPRRSTSTRTPSRPPRRRPPRPRSPSSTASAAARCSPTCGR